METGKQLQVIGIERIHSTIGDCVMIAKAIYAISVLYPNSKIILFASKMCKSLFKNFDFISEIVVISHNETQKQEFLDALLLHKPDVLLLLHRRSWKIKIAKQSKIPLVITELHMHILFSRQFRCPVYRLSYFIHGTEKILRLVRQIDTRHYDENISKIDFSRAKIPTSTANKEKIDLFLQSCNADSHSKIIAINPFGKSNNESFNFTLKDWIDMAQKLAKEFPQILFILTTYQTNPVRIEIDTTQNIKIFCNDDDILNLIEFISRLDLLLSVNTGNIHIADNLMIPTFAINRANERYKCAGGSYGGFFDGIYLPKNYAKDYAHYLDEFYNGARNVILTMLEHIQKP